MDVELQIENIPQSKFGITKLWGSLQAEVEASGYAMMKYEKQIISVDFRKFKKDEDENYYFLPNSLNKPIGKKLGNNFHLIKINPDTLYLDLKSKK